MNRRTFTRVSTTTALGMVAGLPLIAGKNMKTNNKIRLGAPVYGDTSTPETWSTLVKSQGFGAAYCPVGLDADDYTIQAYAKEAKIRDIRISEVGAWSNPVSPDEQTRAAALEKCIAALSLADKIEAGCAVNISGSRGEIWDGPYAENFTRDSFYLIVETTRKIIDAVKPTRSFYTLETMPWALPDSPDSYLELVKAIDRKQFAVHLDPVNMISSPRRYFNNGAFIRECFEKLGPWIKNCHGKDILLRSKLTVHLDEVIPGQGILDYKIFLSELSKLDNVPLMLEHLSTEVEYKQAADHVRAVGRDAGIEFHS